MKKILIIDENDLFRDFLGQKLASFGFDVSLALNGFDGILKMRQKVFDLLIMDYYLSRNSSYEVLERKNQDPNNRLTPVIIATTKIDRNNLMQISKLGIRKFFTKPIKIDALVEAIAEILKVNIEVDNTPCVIEANCNDEIIFVEVAQGLNRDKIELLKFRLQELTALYKVPLPKVIVMMSGLEVGPNDTLLLASLISTIVDHSGARPKNIKILTNSEFIRTYIKNRPAFLDISVVETAEQAMEGLLGRSATNATGENSGQQLGSLLSKHATKNADSGFNMHFEGETKLNTTPEARLKEIGSTASMAIVDDDFVIREIVKKTFTETGNRIDTYVDGADFITNSSKVEYDLIFLDLNMPNMDGFQVLTKLKTQESQPIVIILSALSQKETVVKALGLGVNSYLIKPVEPAELRRKAVDALGTNFQ